MRKVAPVAIDIVVEGELFVLLDVALCKDAHAHLAPHGPLRHDAVRVARVVQEPTFAALLRRVDKLSKAGSVSNLIALPKRRKRRKKDSTYDILVERHEVKVLDTLLGILFDLPLKDGLPDDIANVLVHERVSAQGRKRKPMTGSRKFERLDARWYVCPGAHAEPLLLSLDNLDRSKLSPLEPAGPRYTPMRSVSPSENGLAAKGRGLTSGSGNASHTGSPPRGTRSA